MQQSKSHLELKQPCKTELQHELLKTVIDTLTAVVFLKSDWREKDTVQKSSRGGFFY